MLSKAKSVILDCRLEWDCFVARFNLHQIEMIQRDLDHPECVNFGTDGRLYAGGLSGQVYLLNPPDFSVKLIGKTGGVHAGVAVDGDHNVYACNPGKRAVLKVTQAGDFSVFCDRANDGPTVWPNYGLFDAKGNFYFSDSGLDYWKPSGRLIRVGPGGHAESLIGGNWHFANGLAMSPRDGSIFMIETSAADIIRIPIEDDGNVGAPELFVQLHGNELDGLAFAASGNLYVSCYCPNRVFIVHPDRNVELLIEDTVGDFLNQPTNLAFEPKGTRLFIASLGGQCITALDVGERGASLHYPKLQTTG